AGGSRNLAVFADVLARWLGDSPAPRALQALATQMARQSHKPAGACALWHQGRAHSPGYPRLAAKRRAPDKGYLWSQGWHGAGIPLACRDRRKRARPNQAAGTDLPPAL